MAIELKEGTMARRILGEPRVLEEYFCNFELNPAFLSAFEKEGWVVSGVGSNGEAKTMELAGHPFFLATLYQPQRSSRPGWPHPLITGFVAAAAEFGAARGA
jgi:CTP synthase (UTP-ammonia lyase)